MSYEPTNRPVPSDDPRDLYKNSAVIDDYATSPALTTVDREGKTRRTWAGIEALNSGLGGQLAAPTGATLIGAGVRTQAQKNADIISVRDYITTAVDGVTSNQAGIDAAVAYAYSIGAKLLWPNGNYFAPDSIPNFHKVLHTGPGILKRGSSTWVIDNRSGNNFCYVATTGSDANEGINRLFVDNLYGTNNRWAGVNVDSIGQINMVGGDLQGNTNYNLRIRGGVAVSIGRPAPQRRVKLSNSVGAACQIRDCSSGHFDYVDITNHPSAPTGSGVNLTNDSRLSFNEVQFKNCNVGVIAGGASTFTFTAVTFDNVPTRYRCTGNGVQDDDTDLPGGRGWAYDYFFDRYALGLEGHPVAPFSGTAFVQATAKATTADWAHLVPAATLARSVYGNPTSNTFFRRDYDFANSRIQDVIQGTVRLRVSATDINPAQDNVASCGIAAARWTVVYAATGTINTSDERSKQNIKLIDEACLKAWANVGYVQYKFKDAVEAKGDGARWHFGRIAQRVQEAFEAEGLDAFDYGLLCYDEWPHSPATYDEEGTEVEPEKPAGSRYGIRYEEALALECAYLRSQLKKAE